MAAEKKYKTFWSFYPYYLTEHSDPVCRELHFTGTVGFFLLLFSAFIFQKWWLLALLPVCGYGFAWAGHFFFEKNKPATFQYPLYSLGSDFMMFYHILTDQLPEKLEAAQKELAAG
jgi:hypothetical protein